MEYFCVNACLLKYQCTKHYESKIRLEVRFRTQLGDLWIKDQVNDIAVFLLLFSPGHNSDPHNDCEKSSPHTDLIFQFIMWI